MTWGSSYCPIKQRGEGVDQDESHILPSSYFVPLCPWSEQVGIYLAFNAQKKCRFVSSKNKRSITNTIALSLTIQETEIQSSSGRNGILLNGGQKMKFERRKNDVPGRKNSRERGSRASSVKRQHWRKFRAKPWHVQLIIIILPNWHFSVGILAVIGHYMLVKIPPKMLHSMQTGMMSFKNRYFFVQNIVESGIKFVFFSLRFVLLICVWAYWSVP